MHGFIYTRVSGLEWVDTDPDQTRENIKDPNLEKLPGSGSEFFEIRLRFQPFFNSDLDPDQTFFPIADPGPIVCLECGSESDLFPETDPFLFTNTDLDPT